MSRNGNETLKEQAVALSLSFAPAYVRPVPRPLRVLVAGGFYHLTARGNRRQEIFRDDVDRRHFLALLADVVARHGWKCHAYCLMPNHYHLLVETPDEDLSIGMHRLN